MPPAAVPPVAAAAPAPARILLQFLAGDPGAQREAAWSLLSDSPLVTSFPFLPWEGYSPPGTAARSKLPRSKLVVIIFDSLRAPLDAELAALRTMPFLTHEMECAQAAELFTELAKVKAFDDVYQTREKWQDAMPAFWGKLASADLLRLKADLFYETENYAARGVTPPDELSFLHRLSLADLMEGEEAAPSAALARATLLAASKDTRAERNDETSTLRVIMERVVSLVLRAMHMTTASDAGLARKFHSIMSELHLPATFSALPVTPWQACEDLEAAYAYAHGTAGEALSIEKARILSIGGVYHHLRTVLVRFSSAEMAWIELERLYMGLVLGAAAGTSTLTKLSQLDATFDTAAWRAIMAHALNGNPSISGQEFATLLLASHTSIASTSGGPSASAAGGAVPLAGAGGGAPAFIGGVRDASLEDALRLAGARDALEEAVGTSGVARVEIFLQSDSLVCKRAMLFQEPWLLNKVAALSSCSLDEPYLRPYFSQVICEDDNTGIVPDRLKGFLVDASFITTLRSGKWSQLPILEIALEVKAMNTGASFVPVKASERYVVDACLDLLMEFGPRIFFGAGLSLSPQAGKSFADGVDVQKRAVSFARTLPSAECQEWLAFLNLAFEGFLDGGGELNISKFRTGRPELPEACIEEFVPDDHAYFVNVQSRLTRAEPIADLRVAFPSLLSSAPVSLPGTSSSRGLPDDTKDKDKGKNNDKGKNKNKNSESKSEPGSKASYSYVISDDEIFYCGRVLKSAEIRKKYKLKADICLPVILSKKKGKDALELCPHPDKHGDMSAACHKRPGNFRIDQIYKDHSRKATSNELETANWAPAKKGKN